MENTGKKSIEIDLSKEKIGLAMPCHMGTLPMYTVVGLMETAGMLTKLNIPWTFFNNYQHSLVDQARNEIAEQFMASDCTKIFWIDADIAFFAEDAMRLIALSKLYPMVGALYPIKGLPDGVESYFVDLPEEGPLVTEHGLFHARNCGFGFHVADRAVYEDLAKEAPRYWKRGKEYIDFFHVGRKEVDGIRTPYGEDYWFFRQAEKKGWHLVIDPSVKIGHVGIKVWRGDPAKAFQEVTKKEKVHGPDNDKSS